MVLDLCQEQAAGVMRKGRERLLAGQMWDIGHGQTLRYRYSCANPATDMIKK